VKMSVDVREIPPLSPKNLAGFADESEVNLSWSANNEWDVKSYKIYRNTERNFAPTFFDSIGTTIHPNTKFIDREFEKGTVYFYRIKTVDIDEKESYPSDVINVSPPLSGENIPDSTSMMLWHFNEGKDKVIYDETTNNKDGDIIEPVWINDGRFGRALSFNGRFTAVEVDNISIGKNNQSFTIEMWYRFTEGYQDKDMVFITQGYRRKTKGKWHLRYSSSARMIEGYVEAENGIEAFIMTDKGLRAGVWHHIALVRDAENDILKLYIDGKLAGQMEFSGIFDISNQYKLLIGKDARIIDYVRLSNFYGDIDEVRVSKIAISEFDIITKIAETEDLQIIPDSYNLYQNYPNPFNLSTKIDFDLPQREFVSLKIYNILGQEVRILKDGIAESGKHSVVWDGKNEGGMVMPSGVYFYKFKTENFVNIKKLILLK